MFAPLIKKVRIKYLNKLRVALFLVLTLSVLGIFLSYKTTSEKNLLSQSLTDKEAAVASLNTRVKNLLKENRLIASAAASVELTLINETLEKYQTVKDKSGSYKTTGVVVTTVESQLPTSVDLILAKKYREADTLLSKLDADLETALKAKQAADAAATAATKPKPTTSVSSCTNVPASGYCKLSVKTSNGTFTVYVIAGSISSVKTLTANSESCANNCPTKSLKTYSDENGGYAGMNGTYFCPADYSSCSGKVASFDFPVYNSNLAKWINEDKLFWNDRAMLAFTGSTAVFYPNANSYTTLAGIKAGIVNYPGLVHNGTKIVNNYPLSSSQLTKGTRGGIAVKGSTVYLVIASSATVVDFANVMLELGVTHALNLDGGGSAALYYKGSYKIGPGRSLPNALILK